MLKTVAEAGVRHLGVEPCGGVAETARANGVRVTTEFFQESLASSIRATDGPADVIFGANTISHIPYMDSILRGVDALLGPERPAGGPVATAHDTRDSRLPGRRRGSR